jgi:hypothetical protein
MRQTTTTEVRLDRGKPAGNPMPRFAPAPVVGGACCDGQLKTSRWRSPVRNPRKNFFLSVNYLTPLDRFCAMLGSAGGSTAHPTNAG